MIERPHLVPPRTFGHWRRQVAAAGLAPVVAIAGMRGKTTVIRLLSAIYQHAGLRTALWTDRGVEVDNRRQSGELVPWSRALDRLARGEIDVALQELDWSTIHAVGLPANSYSVAAVTNLCLNNDSCLIQEETRRAFRALAQIRRAAARGLLVLNGEDFAVAGGTADAHEAAVLVGISGEAPLLRGHLAAGGVAAWSEAGELRVGDRRRSDRVGVLDEIGFTLAGAVGFQIQNALTAAAIARASGVAAATIATAIAEFVPTLRDLPGSFNILRVADTTYVVDRPAPSWFLRSSIRALAHIPARRFITLVGDLREVPEDDLWQVGRLLGRTGGALILCEDGFEESRKHSLTLGIGSNEVPPLMTSVGTERQGLNKAFRLVQPGDVVFCLVHHPIPALRALTRASERTSE